MKKFRKAIVALLAMAMVIGCLTMQASAATNVTLYFELPAGWTAATTGVNIWGDGATATGSGSTVNKPSSWGAGTLPQVTDAGSGLVSVVINDTSLVQGIQFVSTDNGAYNPGDSDNLWNAQIASQNLTVAYYSTTGNTANAWYKEDTYATEILPPVLDNIFYVVGQEALVGANWAATDAKGLMTETATDVFTKTFTNIPAGTYEFKVLQDPADFGWDRVVWDDTYTPANGNMTITATETSDITFTVTVGGNGNALNVTVTPVQTPGDTPAGGNDTPAGGNDTPAGGNDTPAGGNDTPAGGNDTPAGGNDTPAGGNDTPAGGNDTPAGGNGGNTTDTNTGVSNAVVAACAVAMLAAVVAVIASKKRVTE